MIQENFEVPEQELLELLNSMEDEDLDNEASEEALARQREYNRNASAEFYQKTRARALQIKRDAFDQKLIDLNAVIPEKHSQLLIAELVLKYDEQIQKNKAYATKRINDLLMMRIPKAIRVAFAQAPQAFKKHPGFLYRTEKILTKEYTLWINIDGPYYFEQGTESEMLHEYCQKYTGPIDRAIANIYRYEAEKKQASVNIAVKLAHLKRNTYLELLQTNPEWFQILYDVIASGKSSKTTTQTYVDDLW